MSEIVECPSCGADTYAGAAACPHCGEPVPKIWRKAAELCDEGPDSMIQCPGCGHQTYADLPDCQKCGRRLPCIERSRRGKGGWSRMLDNLLAGFRS